MFPKLVFALTLAAVGAPAQDTKPPAPPVVGSIAGTVTAAGTGTPMADVEMYANRNSPKAAHAVTDAQGRYLLKGVEPGAVRISANAPAANGRVGFGANSTRQVNLQPGQELTAIDFQMSLPGQISGRVVDQNKEPVPNLTVFLVTREYVAGTLRSVFTSAANTDDQGEYLLSRVMPGRSYTVLAEKRVRSLPAISDAPTEPQLRKRAVIPTYYPNAKSPEGAETLVLRSGEHRERVDIQLVRTPSYCLEGVVEGGSGPADLHFEIAETFPTSGTSGDGGFYSSTPGGTPRPDGTVRICDLHPGDYEMTAMQYSKERLGEPPFFGSANLSITDRDLQNVRMTARPRLPLAGEVVWDGPAPEPPLVATLTLLVQALSRTSRGNTKSAVPGEFSFDGGLLMDDYALQVRGVPDGVYIKDILYGGQSILYTPLRLGSAMGNGGLRIVVARNGATAKTRVADKDGNPVAESTVVVLPASIASEGALAATLITGKTDQLGTWSSPAIAPGKYYVIATNDTVDRSPEKISRLWAARSRGQEVDLSPSGTATVTLAVKSLE